MASRVDGTEFKFEFPVARSAYVPSGRSGPYAVHWLIGVMAFASPLSAVVLMAAQVVAVAIIGCSLGVATALIMLVPALGWVIALLLSFLAVPIVLLGIAGVTAYFAPPVLWWVQAKAERRGHCRNDRWLRISFMLACAGSLVTYVIAVVFLWYWYAERYATTYQTWHGYAVIAWLIAAAIGLVIGVFADGEKLEATPYCESCGKYMQKHELRFGDVEREGVAIDALKETNLGVLSELLDATKKPEHEDHVGLLTWFCFSCGALALAELNTVLVKREYKSDGKVDESTQSRRVHSALLTGPDAAEMRRVFGLAETS